MLGSRGSDGVTLEGGSVLWGAVDSLGDDSHWGEEESANGFSEDDVAGGVIFLFPLPEAPVYGASCSFLQDPNGLTWNGSGSMKQLVSSFRH